GGPSGASTAPTAAPATQAASQAAVATAEPTPDPCAAANLDTITAGTLTVGADNPAYPPFYIPDDTKPAGSMWDLGDPTNGKGLESATAYAIAQQLGFSPDQVTWVVAPFNKVIQPGPKSFDIYLTQVSYNADRAKVVDLSDGYFDLNQAVVALAKDPISKVTTVAGLQPFKLGAQVGTTSYQYIVDQIKPTKDPSVYDTNDAAIKALGAGQIDGVVADLPSTFYMRDAQLTGGQIVGSLPTAPGQAIEHFSVLLNKGSSLTPCVNGAIAALKASGTLDAIRTQWIDVAGAAPKLQ
ncbi:MAG TPA: ABC transporter substrate-binding protein, partial [Candidatus Binatus sp.]|nr:ABC transporter substrate-binding protein [Candidatus Binatus sp.]